MLQLEAFNHQPQTLCLPLSLVRESQGLLDHSRGTSGSWATFSVLITAFLPGPWRAGHARCQVHQLTCVLGTETFLYPLRPERQGRPFPRTFFTAGILGVKFILCEWFHRISQMIVTTFTEFFPTTEAMTPVCSVPALCWDPHCKAPHQTSHHRLHPTSW